MRAAVLGLYAGENDELLRQLVYRSTRITHRDPRAADGALLVALAARYGATHPGRLDGGDFIVKASAAVETEEFREALGRMSAALESGAAVQDFAETLGLSRGISGYILHTVPICLYTWLRHGDDFRGGVETVIRLGGDTDSTAAIVGGLLGARLGPQAIPREWLNGMADWPRTAAWIDRLAQRLALAMDGDGVVRPLPLFWPGLLPRNLLFICIVLMHGLRRSVPLR
jgi:ADP-ribosylglycohydrolase